MGTVRALVYISCSHVLLHECYRSPGLLHSGTLAGSYTLDLTILRSGDLEIWTSEIHDLEILDPLNLMTLEILTLS